MYAAPFEYVRAGSWDEAVAALAEHGEDARVIAGGQSLVPMMTLRMAEPSVLVDVRGAAERTISRENGRLVISALARHADVEASPVVREACRPLAEGAGQIGNVRVRHRGTIGGSLAHAEPTAELPCLAVALDAVVHVLGPGGERTIPARELFVSHFTTTLEEGEVITRVEVPVLGPGRGGAFVELARRPGDFAMVEAAAVLSLDGAGARLVIGATADRPLDVSDALQSLRGEPLEEAALTAAAQAVAEAVEIGPSHHGSEAYRRQLVAVVARRALLQAANRAREGS